TVAADGTWAATLPGQLSEGTHQAFASVVGGSGADVLSSPYQFVVDLSPPTVSLQAPTYTINPTPTVAVSVRSADGIASTVAIDVDLNHNGSFADAGETGFAKATLDSSGNAQVKLNHLDAGTYQVRARGQDVACNEGSATATMQVTSDPFARMPLRFEANLGQTDPQVQYLARARDYTLFLTNNGVVLSLQAPQAPATPPAPPTDGSLTLPTPPPMPGDGVVPFRVDFLGSSMNASVMGIDQLSGVSNYLIANDPSQWLVNVPNYSEVHSQGLYPGIDAVFMGSQSNLRYDFLVAPGADASAIRFGFGDAQASLKDGNLVLSQSGLT